MEFNGGGEEKRVYRVYVYVCTCVRTYGGRCMSSLISLPHISSLAERKRPTEESRWPSPGGGRAGRAGTCLQSLPPRVQKYSPKFFFVSFLYIDNMFRLFASNAVRSAARRFSTRAAPKSKSPLLAGVTLGATATTAAYVLYSDVALSDAPSFHTFFSPDYQTLLRRTAEVQVQISGKTNSAFVFIKPHAAASDKVKDLVRGHFKKHGIRITGEGDLDAQTIDENMLIDTHYGAIASKAVKLDPTELNVPEQGKEKFKNTFGLAWDDALAAGRVYNAKQACAKLNIDGPALDKKLGKKVKFGGGFYAFQVDDIWVINGFYMQMRNSYTKKESNGIHYFTVQWPTDSLSWKDFRGEVLGATDPAEASEGSARRMIYDNWEALELPEKPNTGDNGVHASASPFEAMAERNNWLGMTKEQDPFALGMLASGVSLETMESWQEDPQVQCGNERGSLFDFLEDLDADDCLAKSRTIQQ